MTPSAACLSILLALVQAPALPEHPRPDFQRAEWLNLNGRWQFWFGQQDSGKREIVVPFTVTRAKLRPLLHNAGFLGLGAPLFEIRKYALSQVDAKSALGRAGKLVLSLLAAFAPFRG